LRRKTLGKIVGDLLLQSSDSLRAQQAAFHLAHITSPIAHKSKRIQAQVLQEMERRNIKRRPVKLQTVVQARSNDSRVQIMIRLDAAINRQHPHSTRLRRPLDRRHVSGEAREARLSCPNPTELGLWIPFGLGQYRLGGSRVRMSSRSGVFHTVIDFHHHRRAVCGCLGLSRQRLAAVYQRQVEAMARLAVGDDIAVQ
jgi:hypothetical protein